MLTSDYHIHSHYSPCASDAMRLPQILDAAEKRGLTHIGISDHCYSFDLNSRRVRELREELTAVAKGRKLVVSLGLEAYILRHRLASITPEVGALFDYVIMAPNHYNIRGVAQPIRLHPRILGDHELYMLEAAINHPATDVVAHPLILSPRVFRVAPDRLAEMGRAMFEELDQKRLVSILDRARQRNLAIELNPKMFTFGQEHLESFYRLCLEREVKLAYGSDAHDLDEVGVSPEMERLVRQLGISAEHLWRPGAY